jgi:hypothetical protein
VPGSVLVDGEGFIRSSPGVPGAREVGFSSIEKAACPARARFSAQSAISLFHKPARRYGFHVRKPLHAPGHLARDVVQSCCRATSLCNTETTKTGSAMFLCINPGLGRRKCRAYHPHRIRMSPARTDFVPFSLGKAIVLVRHPEVHQEVFRIKDHSRRSSTTAR